MQTHKAYDLQNTYDQAKAFSYRLQDPCWQPRGPRLPINASGVYCILPGLLPESPESLLQKANFKFVVTSSKPHIQLILDIWQKKKDKLTSLRSTITSTHHINFASSTARVPVQCYQGNLSVPMLKRAHMNDYIEYVNVQCWSIIYVVVLIFFLGFSEGP